MKTGVGGDKEDDFNDNKERSYNQDRGDRNYGNNQYY